MKITKRKKLAKKGIAGSQLNWVFMLIAGVVILMFFFFIVQRQRALSKETLAEKILTDLRGLFTGAAVSTGATNYFETPLLRFDFTCDADTCTEYGCGDSSFSMPDYSKIRKTLSLQPLFSPGSLRGNGMTVITKPWNVPFKAINFVYITNPTIAYVVIFDSGNRDAQEKAEQIHNDLLPDEKIEQKGKDRRLIVKRIYDNTQFSKIRNIQQEQIKIINIEAFSTGIPRRLNTIKTYLKKTDAEKITAIVVSPTDNLEASSSIGFFVYDKDKNKWIAEGTSYYVGSPSFIGAIYAKDQSNYDCNMMKALAAFAQISRLYETRRQALEDAASRAGDESCLKTYSDAGINLDILTGIKPPLTESKASEIYHTGIEETKGLSSLADYNNKLQRWSCSSIY